jgi:hypothetical protein
LALKIIKSSRDALFVNYKLAWQRTLSNSRVPGPTENHVFGPLPEQGLKNTSAPTVVNALK